MRMLFRHLSPAAVQADRSGKATRSDVSRRKSTFCELAKCRAVVGRRMFRVSAMLLMADRFSTGYPLCNMCSLKLSAVSECEPYGRTAAGSTESPEHRMSVLPQPSLPEANVSAVNTSAPAVLGCDFVYLPHRHLSSEPSPKSSIKFLKASSTRRITGPSMQRPIFHGMGWI